MAIVIVAVSLWYTNLLVREIAKNQRDNIRIWADAIHRKAELVNYTDEFFGKLQNEERKRVELLAEAYRSVNFVKEGDSDVLNFLLQFIKGNTTIPVILTDERRNITNAVNIDFDVDTIKVLKGELYMEFNVYPPIQIKYSENRSVYLYYKDSRLFTELRVVLDDLVDSFFSEVVLNSASVPVIITDSSKTKILEYGLIDSKNVNDSVFMAETLEQMASDNEPIEIELAEHGKRYIFYQDSYLLTRLMFFPYFQLSVIALFLIISYIFFSSARKSEQNQVWVGLAKETAHQLGTPLSSIMAWIELLKMEGQKGEMITELNKDVERLQKITERFSKIGSEPKLRKTNIVEVIYNSIAYIQTRSSQKVKYSIQPGQDQKISAPINLNLFEWVIENLSKNAIDATGGDGNISVEVLEEVDNVIIDITDDGKGIPKSQFKTVFNPGFTSKKRGWGLGLSLAKRIITDYHKGKIFVKASSVNKGTTFRIILKKQND